MYEEVKDRAEKGYARMVTNYGALNFEVGAQGVFPFLFLFLLILEADH